MSLVDDSFVTQKTVGGMLVYLMLLCFFFGLLPDHVLAKSCSVDRFVD
jgi:hypothetical protein